jgi:acetyltransferase-like isoleucine patch superfamily enzyme
MIAKTAHVYEGTVLGSGVSIEDFAIVGVRPATAGEELSAARLGDGVLIRSHSVLYAGTTLGNKTQTGHGALIRESTSIGDEVSIGSHSVVEHHVRIADKVRIHSQVFVPEYSVLETGAWLGPNVVLTNARFPLGREIKKRLEGVWIGACAIVGANSTILPGVRIGNGALVGAGSVVTHDVPDGCVVVGNPAHVLCRVEELRYGDGVVPY